MLNKSITKKLQHAIMLCTGSVFEVFLVHIFPHLDWTRIPNAGKYGPKKLRIRKHFMRWWCSSIHCRPPLNGTGHWCNLVSNSVHRILESEIRKNSDNVFRLLVEHCTKALMVFIILINFIFCVIINIGICSYILKVGLSPSKKKYFYLLEWKPFKNDEKCFLFHLESSFRSPYIKIFVLTFWSYRKNGLIRKVRLISKFMTTWLTNNYDTHIA